MRRPTQRGAGSTFVEIYQAKKAAFENWRALMAEAALVQPATVDAWAWGKRKPSERAQTLIAAKMGMPVEVLFPPKEQTTQET